MSNSLLEGRSLTGGILDLEAPIHGNQSSMVNLAAGPSFSSWCQMGLGTSLTVDHRSASNPVRKGSSSSSFPKGKADATEMSEEEEPSFTEDGNDDAMNAGKGRRSSPWRRMKWTDSVIRLLIAVVARVGDDGSFDSVCGAKRKSRILQKKGKWKTVSKIMNGKGCHVSPQQCEDKFNDLNKRYKKLNEILGRGTSCNVVENPAMMDAMPHLSAKAKDVVRKILSSKHLFYKEMCAYHNGQAIPDCPEIDLHGCCIELERSSKEGNLSEDDEGDESGASEDVNEGDESNDSSDGDAPGRHGCKSSEQTGGAWAVGEDLAQVLRNPKMSIGEKKEWMEKKRVQILDKSVGVHAAALELEKQRFKWLRYRSKKDEEFERLRLENERLKLEYEQSVLLLRRKLLEIDSEGHLQMNRCISPSIKHH